MIGKQDLWSRLKAGLGKWMQLNLFLLLCMLVLRMLFYLEVHTRIGIDAAQFGGIMKGAFFDLVLLCRIAAWLFLPFMALYVFFPKTTGKLYTGLVFLYVVVAAILAEYYCNLFMPLDHVILVYTPEEVKGTVDSSANITAAPFLWFFGTLALTVALLLLWRKVKPGFVFSAVLLVAMALVACLVPYKQIIREERYYNDHGSFCLAVNQPSYSYIKITDHLRDANQSFVNGDNEVSVQVLEASQRYHTLHPEFSYSSAEYPFYRKADDPDVLGSFLERTSDSLPPDMVFIIVESLGQRLTGVDFPELSFTPFIDSLKQESLYWQNCISTSERTFGVLPSVFGSVPYGRSGFCVTGRPMPNHNSLLRDLRNNGYKTSYYYGGVHDFDRFDSFLKANKVDFIYVPDMHEVDSATYRYLNDNHRWGLDDIGTVQAVMEHKVAQPSTRPNLDIVMTLTTHEPFFFKEVEEYMARVDTLLKANPQISQKEREVITDNKNIYACYLYMDDCVRQLVDFYKTLPAYRNTVFVLTGDHRMGPLNFSGQLNKYNVPLLVFSPLLRQPRAMDAVVSHLDITPTLSAYLSQNYNYQISDSCHWIGTSLDTVKAYRNRQRQAFMLNNRDVVEYLNGDFFLSNNRLFRVDEHFLLDQVDDEKNKVRMKKEMDDYNTLSRYAVQTDHLNHTDRSQIVLRSVNKEEESLIEPDMKYINLMENLIVKDVYQDLFVELSVDVQSLDTTVKMPFVVVKWSDYYMGVKMVSDDEVSLNTGEMEHFHTRLSISMDPAWKGEPLKIYFYNSAEGRMAYNHVRLNVSAVH
ncbi:MAG: LTA synthase family protein [Bacteroidales bacterium]|nr:LTA synthase family protein [Bacteroidales bacterium]